MWNRRLFGATLFSALIGSTAAYAKADCPAPVTDAAMKAYPGAKITACKQEKEHGKTQFEVKLDTKQAKQVELDVSPEGGLLLTEEKIAVDAVPKTVMSGFSAKYPQAKAERAEKQTKADGTVSYELAFQANGKRHEATFGQDGRFVEEE